MPVADVHQWIRSSNDSIVVGSCSNTRSKRAQLLLLLLLCVIIRVCYRSFVVRLRRPQNKQKVAGVNVSESYRVLRFHRGRTAGKIFISRQAGAFVCQRRPCVMFQ